MDQYEKGETHDIIDRLSMDDDPPRMGFNISKLKMPQSIAQLLFPGVGDEMKHACVQMRKKLSCAHAGM